MSDEGASPPVVEPTGQSGRYQRSTSGMVGALLVTLLVIFAFVAFRACNRTNLDVEPQRVDYRAQVGYAQQAGARLVYPGSLPSGWYATQVAFDEGKQPQLEISMLTADGRYAGFVQSPAPASELLARYVDAHPTGGGSIGVPGAVDGAVTRWDLWTDSGGDTALVARHHGATLLVFGSASQSQLEQLTASLTTAKAR